MSDIPYESLIEWGAPRLPEGHFYRVKSPTVIDTITVQLRRRRRFGSKLLAESTHWLPEHGNNTTATEFVASLLYRLYRQHDWESTKGARFDRDLEALVGDHP